MTKEQEVLNTLFKMDLGAVGAYLQEKASEDQAINELTRNISGDLAFYERMGVIVQIQHLAIVLKGSFNPDEQ